MRKLAIYFFFLLSYFAVYGQSKTRVFNILYDSKDALQCRIDLIQQAKKEILLSYFIITDDFSGTLLLSLLAEASSKRGVIVQILIDKNGSKISLPMQAYLKKNGVVINKFVLKNKALKKYYHGLHEKILITDQHQMIVGGRNIKDNYFGLSSDFNFFDYDVLVTGDSLIQDARIHFYTLWHDERLSSPYPTDEVTEQESLENLEKIHFATNFVQQKLQIRMDTKTNWLPDIFATTAPIGFINDDFYIKKGRNYVGSDEKDMGSTNAHIRFIDSAKYSICIENPYFVPTKAWKNALHNALLRGVKVRLLTNSIRSTDLPVRQAAYRNQRKKWLRWGLEIWEYHGTEKWHAKALVIDNQTVVIGSYNIHRPSERYNTEVAVWIKEPKTAKTQEIVMAHNLDNSIQIGGNNRKIQKPIQNFKRASFGLRCKVFLYQHTVSWVFGWLM